MWLDAILAYLHYTAVFVLFAFLTVEVMISRAALDAKAVAMLARVDLWYVGATVAALVTGFARALWGAKGWAFYSGDWVFHAKVTLFLVVAALAIPPALAILRWNRRAAAEPGFAVPEDERRRLRRYLMGEVHAAAVIPVLAVMMARGLGR
jgi:putative membrane protein